MEIGVVNPAILGHIAFGLISAVSQSSVGFYGIVANAIGDVGHNPVECEWIGPIGFGEVESMAESVVVLEGFHRFRLRGLRDGLK